MTRRLLFLFFFLFFIGTTTLLAQINPPPPTCFGGPVGSENGSPCCLVPGACGISCPACTPIPLKGELYVLLIAGLIYGSFKFLKNKAVT
ncbi:MAG: hypothetical protein HRT71_20535 [Flavobacteriales bacterium]|nr:hypothetical protein [Flavobacteriales bacterium]